MFYDINGEIIKILLEEEKGCWVISFDNPKAPYYIDNDNLKNYKQINYPDEYIKNMNPKKIRTLAEQKRFQLIKELIEDTNNIKSKKDRKQLIKKIATDNNTTEKRIFNLYYMYLAKGSLIKTKNKKVTDTKYKDDFLWAIRSFYYSAKKLSLQETYDLLLLSKYTTNNGKLKNTYPSWNQFKYFFYKNSYHKDIKKEISRDGLSSYQRNSRPLYGKAIAWKDKIGCYQMDATIADIYLVSRFDNKTVIGRPNIYLAVDTISQLIAGIYVGLDSGTEAVVSCLVNAAENKVAFCKKYNITIKENEWPSYGLPKKIIVDKGTEFVYGLPEELFKIYGLEVESLPPFRPDEKGIVEKTFDLIQSKYKQLLYGKGVVDSNFQERWSKDYKKEARLNLDEFTAIVIHCVIYMNNIRMLKNYIFTKEMIEDNLIPTPSNIWNWFKKQNKTDLVLIDQKKLYLMSLKRKQTSISRKGINHNGIYYKNSNITQILKEINGTSITIAYDKENIKCIYLILNETYIPFYMPNEYKEYFSLSEKEYYDIKQQIKQNQKKNEKRLIEQKLSILQNMKNIIDNNNIEIKDVSNIKRNRDNERNKLS